MGIYGVVFFLLILCDISHGTTPVSVWVDSLNGNDVINTGSENQPFASLFRALQAYPAPIHSPRPPRHLPCHLSSRLHNACVRNVIPFTLAIFNKESVC